MNKRLAIILAGIGIILVVIVLLFGDNIYQLITEWSTNENGRPLLVTEKSSIEETLARTNGCLECHGIEKKIIGPAFRDIAAKYKDDPSAHDALIETVKKGGKGNWTDISSGVPMPPYSPRLTDAEIEQLVDWVLGQ